MMTMMPVTRSTISTTYDDAGEPHGDGDGDAARRARATVTLSRDPPGERDGSCPSRARGLVPRYDGFPRELTLKVKLRPSQPRSCSATVPR